MLRDQFNQDQYDLYFDVRRSIRYHDRRRSFFEIMQRVTSVLTILMAGSVLFDLGKTGVTANWLIYLSVLAALLATFDMVIGYAGKADLHRSLKVRFGKLEMAIIAGGDSQKEWDGHQLQKLEIELDEPAIYRALDLLCFNELANADGINKENFVKLNFIHRLTCHFLHWPNISNNIKTNIELSANQSQDA